MGAFDRHHVGGDVTRKREAPHEWWHFMDKGEPNPARAFRRRIMVPHIVGHPDDEFAYMSRPRAEDF
jgi:hypothetical protein